MKLSYKCKNCKKEFKIPKIEYEARDPMGVCDNSFTEKFEVCPHCESLNFEVKEIKYDFEKDEEDI